MTEVRRGWPPNWRFFITDLEMQTVSILDQRSTNKQLMFALNQPAMHTGQVASDDVEINIPFPDPDSPANLSHNTRLCFGLRREPGATPPYVSRFAGIVMQCEDDGADAPTTRYTAYDPWQYLFNRPARDIDYPYAVPTDQGQTFFPEENARASDIALGLIAATDAIDGNTFIDFSDLALIENTAILEEKFTIEAGATVGEALNQLVETGTIDIWLEPDYDGALQLTGPGGTPRICKLHIYPQKGIVQDDAIMGWDNAGKSLTSINRLVDGTRLANYVQFFVGSGGIPVAPETDATSTSTYGVYWAMQFFPNSLDDAGLVGAAALADLIIRRNGQRTISFDPAPELSLLSLRDYQLGDYLPVWASKNLREPIGVDYGAYLADPDNPGAAGYMKVYAIPIEIDDNGVERVRGLIASKDTPTFAP